MTIVRLGYVAMSVHLQNSSPSQTMTFAQFTKLKNREAALRKLERIAQSNLQNCLRLLKHNLAFDITFFRLSSKLIPLANHEELQDWDYLESLAEGLQEIGEFVHKHDMRIGFHPDHFVLLNSPNIDILNASITTLRLHEALLRGMNIDREHRCVMHVGGGYKNKEKALEQFIHNWQFVPQDLQEMVMLENDDVTFNLQDTLYLCEKLGIPLVFDYHHHLANHQDENWEQDWERVVQTWSFSKLPLKMHISSPKSEKEFRAHADYINPETLLHFLQQVKGSVPQIDCMIEAKRKDDALFKLMNEIVKDPSVKKINGSTFKIE
ncbi:UV DNA damage endonuclease [Bacillus mesophilus]|uniref:UV DNA damage repair endonuclease UvsE n=1 Tax=Bacillus mesophilus TaxID=1808955 RepID=A0A6M0QBZ5_9BACI|nr:UV DNA damage repair endonuclease UvsE [Bacillus mesophilus]MBM7663142.1 UV DNA damage endonuclease [Bacillus mesophilus]NEY73882.1 UV DNA damage repair endonuclease UvsE [Bacillus mesophilus]